MIQNKNTRYYLEGNMLIIIEGGVRSTRGYQTEAQAREAYESIPGTRIDPAWPITTRETAETRYYYTGKLCRNNHDAQRYVNSGACMSCHADNVAAYRRRRGKSDK